MMFFIVYEMKLLGLILFKSTKKLTHLYSNPKLNEVFGSIA